MLSGSDQLMHYLNLIKASAVDHTPSVEGTIENRSEYIDVQTDHVYVRYIYIFFL